MDLNHPPLTFFETVAWLKSCWEEKDSEEHQQLHLRDQEWRAEAPSLLQPSPNPGRKRPLERENLECARENTVGLQLQQQQQRQQQHVAASSAGLSGSWAFANQGLQQISQQAVPKTWSAPRVPSAVQHQHHQEQQQQMRGHQRQQQHQQQQQQLQQQQQGSSSHLSTAAPQKLPFATPSGLQSVRPHSPNPHDSASLCPSQCNPHGLHSIMADATNLQTKPPRASIPPAKAHRMEQSSSMPMPSFILPLSSTLPIPLVLGPQQHAQHAQHARRLPADPAFPRSPVNTIDTGATAGTGPIIMGEPLGPSLCGNHLQHRQQEQYRTYPKASTHKTARGLQASHAPAPCMHPVDRSPGYAQSGHAQQPPSHPQSGYAQPGHPQSSPALLDKLEGQAGAAGLSEGGVAGLHDAEPRWPWLVHKRDASGLPEGHPHYDPTTLLVPEAALRQMTKFNRQFWQIKSTCFDIVLFVRHGSFYNLFDVDAEVGMSVGLVLSGERRQNMWKCGCNKDAFPVWAAKVMALGFRVGRVEEIPDHTAASKAKGGDILQRKLCQIYTPGTYVIESYMDDKVAPPQPRCSSSHATPTLVSCVEAGNGRLGVAVLDASLGSLQLGEIHDTPSRTTLSTLLLRCACAEAVAPHGSLSPATLACLTRHTTPAAAAAAASAAPVAPAAVTVGARRGLLSCLPRTSFPPASCPHYVPPAFTSPVFGGGGVGGGGNSGGEFDANVGGMGCSSTGGSAAVVRGNKGGAGAGEAAGVPTGSGVRGLPQQECSHDAALQCCAALLGTDLVQALRGLATSIPTTVPPFRSNSLGDKHATPPQQLLRVLQQLRMEGQPLAAHVAAVLLMHLSRCCVLGQITSALDTSRLDACWTPGQGAPVQQPAMLLDHAAITSLELLEGSLGGHAGSLFAFLARAGSPMGLRRIGQWLCRPLTDVREVQKRQAVVSFFTDNPEIRLSFLEATHLLPDLERLMCRSVSGLRPIAGDRWQQQQFPEEHKKEANPRMAGGAAWAVPASCAAYTALNQLLHGLALAWHSTNLIAKAESTTGTVLPAELITFLSACEPAAEALDKLNAIFDFMDASCPRGQLTLQPPKPEALAYDDRAAAAAEMQEAERALQEVLLQVQQHLRDHGAPQALLAKVVMCDDASQGILRCPAALGPLLVQAGFTLQPSPARGQLIHAHLPWLSELGEACMRARDAAERAEQQLLLEGVRLFLALLPDLEGLVHACACLDALAGCAEACCPENAPAGCTFSRPILLSTEECRTQSHPAVKAPVIEGAPRTGSRAGGILRRANGSTMSSSSSSGSGEGSESGEQLGAGDVLWLEDLWNPQLTLRDNKGCADDGNQGVTPNSVSIGGNWSPQIFLLTGTNMGGKSTLLRAACIATILAHMGCNVPCRRATISVVDRIWMRMGAHDRIMLGESTFMVEMSETAAGLAGASRSSLVVLDELGRGTATHDGYALAYAVLAHLGRGIGCRTLFTTHYHGLTHEPLILPQVSLAHMAHTTTPQGQFLPLHTLRSGPAPEGSSGIHVASMAGLPPRLCAQAHKVAAHLFQQLQQRQHPAAPCLDTLLDKCQQGAAFPMSTVEFAAFKYALRTLQHICAVRQ